MNHQTITIDPQVLQITTNLQNKIPTGSIFCSTPPGGRTYITLVMESAATELAGEMYGLAAEILSPNPDVSCRIFEYDYAASALADGNLYFTRHCLYGQVVCEKESEKLLLNASNLTELLARAVASHDANIKRVSKTYEGLTSHIDSEDYVQAAIVLHLTLRELYRSAASFMAGKATLDASLYLQQAFLSEYAPSLAEIFSYGDEVEKRLFESIEEAYGFDFGNCSMAISESQVSALIEKTEVVMAEVNALFDRLLEDCRGFQLGVQDLVPVRTISKMPVPAITEQPDSLASITAEFVALANPDFIWLQRGVAKNPQYNVLLVMVDRDQRENTSTSYHANVIVAGYKSFRYRLYTRQYIEEELENGCLFFISSVLFGKAVAANPEALAFDRKHYDVEGLLEKARRNFSVKMEKVKGFRAGADFYIANGNNIQAAFALRQAIETLYKLIEYFMTGSEEKVGRLHDHQMTMRDFVPQLGELFTIDGTDERWLMQLLDSVYKMPHGGELIVDRADLEIIQTKATRLEAEVVKYFEKMIRQCEDLHRRPSGREFDTEELSIGTAATETKGPAAIDAGIELVVKIIAGFIKTDSIHCFGQRTKKHSSSSIIQQHGRVNEQVHFDLLVVSSDTRPNAIADLADLVRTKSGFRISVTLLIHKPKQILYALDRYKHFFYNVLHHGTLVYSNPTVDLVSLDICPPRDIAAAKKYCRRRNTIAEMFVESTCNDNSDEGQGEMAMMHIIAEHVCLALIEGYLGYRPRHFALGSLFDLCLHFCTLPDDIFPRETLSDRKMFKMLSTGVSNLRLNEFKDYTYTNTEVIHDRCSEFHRQAMRHIQNELDRIALVQKQNESDSQ